MDIKILLGRKIQEIRKSKNLTQEHVAELLNIETSSLSNIERGKYYPTADNLAKISDILEVEPYELFDFKYLSSHQELLDEMLPVMKTDEKITRLMYKFFKSIV